MVGCDATVRGSVASSAVRTVGVVPARAYTMAASVRPPATPPQSALKAGDGAAEKRLAGSVEHCSPGEVPLLCQRHAQFRYPRRRMPHAACRMPR